MKMRLLPQIDLVRAMPLSRMEKRALLQKVKFFRPTLSYRAVRAVTPDLFNVRPGCLEPTTSCWSEIANAISSRCLHEAERMQNLAVGKQVFEDSTQRRLTGFQHQLFPLKIGISGGVVLWSDFYVVVDGVPVFPFIDPRRSNGLGPIARNVAFSLMHQRIRADGGDFASAEFAIYKFPSEGSESRRLSIYSSDGAEMYSYDDLEQMIQEVYEVWEEVLSDREAEKRRAAGGRVGSLGI